MGITHKCEGNTFDGYYSHPCMNNAKVERDGKWYCGIHDPVVVAERQAKKQAKFDEEWKAIKAARKRREQADKAYNTILETANELHTSPEKVIECLPEAFEIVKMLHTRDANKDNEYKRQSLLMAMPELMRGQRLLSKLEVE